MSSARIEELRKKFDENPRRYFAPLANEYRKAGDFDQAIFICQEYLPQQPGHMSGHIVFGQALFEAKRLPEAKNVFETALSLDPENLIALRHLADISRDLGDTAAAKGWYERVLVADPRNEEIAAIVAQLGSGGSPAAAAAAPTAETPAKPAPPSDPRPVAKTLPEGVAAAAAPTMELSAAAVQEMVKARQAAKQAAEPKPEPEQVLETMNLDTTPTVEINAASAEAAPMEGLEPTSHAGGMDIGGIETLGLESNTVPGQQPDAAVSAPAPLDGLDTISLDLSTFGSPPPAAAPPPPEAARMPEPAGEGLLDLGSFSIGGEPMSPAAAPAPSAAETPIDGGHDSGDLIDLDFDTPGPTPEPEPAASIPTMIIDAVKSVVPAMQEAVESTVPIVMDAVESAAPAMMDFVDTTIPSVVDTVKSAVEAVVESPTVIMEAIKVPPKAEPPVAPARTSGSQRPSQGVPFVTETMAQLYLSQGHRAEAIDIYRKLIDARPDDAGLKARLAEIESDQHTATTPAPVEPVPAAASAPKRFTGSGPSIRVVLRELFGLDGSASYSTATAAAAPSMPAEVGSIDLLFSSQAIADPLSPLAVAFDGGYVAAQGTVDDLFSGVAR